LLLSLAAEGALQQIACFADSCHAQSLDSEPLLRWGFCAYLCSP
jgi:hypothetical protein